MSTATSTDIAVDIAVDITYSKHDPTYLAEFQMVLFFTRKHDLDGQKELTNLYLLFRHTKFQVSIVYFVTKIMHEMYCNYDAPHPQNSTTARKPALIFSLYRVHA